MWPGCDSRTRRHMWVEFVVGSRPCSERFSPRSLVPTLTPTPLSQTIFSPPNSSSIWIIVKHFIMSLWLGRASTLRAIEVSIEVTDQKFGCVCVARFLISDQTRKFGLSTRLIAKGKLATVKRFEC